MGVWSQPVIGGWFFGKFFEQRMLLHIFGLDNDAVGQVFSEMWRVWVAEERFSAYRLQAISAKDNIRMDVRKALDLRRRRLKVNPGNERVQLHLHAQSLCFCNENLVIVCAIYMKIGMAIYIFYVGD